MNSVSDMLSGYTAKGAPVKKGKQAGPDPTLALTGETDVQLVADFFPTAIKLYEVIYFQNPTHGGMAVMTGSLYIMYANAFIQAEAERLPVSKFDVQDAAFRRAKGFYLRGRNYVLDALDRKYPGFKASLLSGDEEKTAGAVEKLKKDDVNAAYWLGAGWLGALSLDKGDSELLSTVQGPVMVLEKAAALDPSYNHGAIWDLLLSFHGGGAADFGGDPSRAEECFQASINASGGKLPGPYIAWAESVCESQNDAAGFEENLKAALAINPDDIPEARLATTIAQQKARWLLENKSLFFIEW
ncbi:MAG: TRAP transporter TatT component family protein [Spirochaetaceae bacterium]|nr:TRAP transporter TatT component family protein [Spirochaetaceae bacterium]